MVGSIFAVSQRCGGVGSLGQDGFRRKGPYWKG
jgi:hypothetical protein